MPLCNATGEVQGAWGCPEIVDHKSVWIFALAWGIAPVDIALIWGNRDQKTVDAARPISKIRTKTCHFYKFL
jgi:hypothetical protein